jgi:hypothetical protein
MLEEALERAVGCGVSVPLNCIYGGRWKYKAVGGSLVRRS